MIVKLLEEVKALVGKELDRANCDHEPLFNSNHEAYAVAKEELEEAKDMAKYCEIMLLGLWECVKQDDNERIHDRADSLEDKAMMLACEAIQLAAMARKWKQTWAYQKARKDWKEAEEKRIDSAPTLSPLSPDTNYTVRTVGPYAEGETWQP